MSDAGDKISSARGEPEGIRLRRAEVGEILALRHELLRYGMPAEEARFDGDDDAGTWHFGAFDAEERAIGCVTYLASSWEGERAWRLRGMAVADGHQRRGLGRRLLEFAEAVLIQNSDARVFWCNARTAAAKFYEKQGWRRASEEFEVPSIGPHCRMTKRVEE